jgi:hypothetical protein
MTKSDASGTTLSIRLSCVMRTVHPDIHVAVLPALDVSSRPFHCAYDDFASLAREPQNIVF